MSDETPITGYRPQSADSSGAGGRTREAKIMGSVDAAVSGHADAAHPAASALSPASAGQKTHPSSYAPSADAGPRVYGAPVSTPILGGGK